MARSLQKESIMVSTSHIHVLLLAEDELMASAVAEYLQMKTFDVTIEKEGIADLMRKRLDEMHKRLDNEEYDVCVIYPSRSNDWALQVLSDLRTISTVPAILAMRDAEKNTMIAGYGAGADDVQKLPISTELLACKIEAIVRREHMHESPLEYRLGSIVFNVSQQRLSKANGDLIGKLSGKEMELLEVLAQHINKPVEKGVILRKIWNEDNYFTSRSLSVYITKLKKLLASEPGVTISFVHGKGYRLSAPY